MEVFIENKLRREFSSLEVVCNDRECLGIELDFYFPKIRLAIEINGIVHYEPIYGSKSFDRVQNNDKQKVIRTSELGIELIVIPTFGSFSLKQAEFMWESIKSIIESRI